MEEIVTFCNYNNRKLFGVVHSPDDLPSHRTRIGVNLLNPGIKYRVAPHRLNVKIARRLCQQGLYVFRFDPEGIGDSEGELPIGQSMNDIWGSIQRGLFVNDTKASNDFFVKKYNIDELIIIGNCGGAITAMLTAAIDSRINKVILIDMPVILMGSDYSFADTIFANSDKTDFLFIGYLRNLLKISSWKNLLAGRTDLKALKKIIKIQFKKFTTKSDKSRSEILEDKNYERPRLNEKLFECFTSLIDKKRQFLFITAGNDAGAESFQLYFQKRYLLQEKKYSYLFDTFLVEHANHIYSFDEWQERLISRISDWIIVKAQAIDNSQK